MHFLPSGGSFSPRMNDPDAAAEEIEDTVEMEPIINEELIEGMTREEFAHRLREAFAMGNGSGSEDADTEDDTLPPTPPMPPDSPLDSIQDHVKQPALGIVPQQCFVIAPRVGIPGDGLQKDNDGTMGDSRTAGRMQALEFLKAQEDQESEDQEYSEEDAQMISGQSDDGEDSKESEDGDGDEDEDKGSVQNSGRQEDQDKYQEMRQIKGAQEGDHEHGNGDECSVEEFGLQEDQEDEMRPNEGTQHHSADDAENLSPRSSATDEVPSDKDHASVTNNSHTRSSSSFGTNEARESKAGLDRHAIEQRVIEEEIQNLKVHFYWLQAKREGRELEVKPAEQHGKSWPKDRRSCKERIRQLRMRLHEHMQLIKGVSQSEQATGHASVAPITPPLSVAPVTPPFSIAPITPPEQAPLERRTESKAKVARSTANVVRLSKASKWTEVPLTEDREKPDNHSLQPGCLRKFGLQSRFQTRLKEIRSGQQQQKEKSEPTRHGVQDANAFLIDEDHDRDSSDDQDENHRPDVVGGCVNKSVVGSSSPPGEVSLSGSPTMQPQTNPYRMHLPEVAHAVTTVGRPRQEPPNQTVPPISLNRFPHGIAAESNEAATSSLALRLMNLYRDHDQILTESQQRDTGTAVPRPVEPKSRSSNSAISHGVHNATNLLPLLQALQTRLKDARTDSGTKVLTSTTPTDAQHGNVSHGGNSATRLLQLAASSQPRTTVTSAGSSAAVPSGLQLAESSSTLKGTSALIEAIEKFESVQNAESELKTLHEELFPTMPPNGKVPPWRSTQKAASKLSTGPLHKAPGAMLVASMGSSPAVDTASSRQSSILPANSEDQLRQELLGQLASMKAADSNDAGSTPPPKLPSASLPKAVPAATAVFSPTPGIASSPKNGIPTVSLEDQLRQELQGQLASMNTGTSKGGSTVIRQPLICRHRTDGRRQPTGPASLAAKAANAEGVRSTDPSEAAQAATTSMPKPSWLQSDVVSDIRWESIPKAHEQALVTKIRWDNVPRANKHALDQNRHEKPNEESHSPPQGQPPDANPDELRNLRELRLAIEQARDAVDRNEMDPSELEAAIELMEAEETSLAARSASTRQLEAKEEYEGAGNKSATIVLDDDACTEVSSEVTATQIASDSSHNAQFTLSMQRPAKRPRFGVTDAVQVRDATPGAIRGDVPALAAALLSEAPEIAGLLQDTARIGWMPEGKACHNCKKTVVKHGGVFCGRFDGEERVGCGKAVCWRCMNRASHAEMGRVRTTKAEFQSLGVDAWWMHDFCMRLVDRRAYFPDEDQEDEEMDKGKEGGEDDEEDDAPGCFAWE